MLEETLIPSAALGRNRAVWLDSPEGHEPARFCLVLDAENYLCNVGIGAIRARLEEAGETGPMTVVFLPFVTPENRHSEYACHPGFERFVCEDLMAWARLRFPSLQPGGHALIGLSLSGLQAIWTALRHPGLFTAVVGQSPSAWFRNECLREAIDPKAEPKASFWISVGSEETTSGEIFQPGNLHQTTSQFESCGRLVDALRTAGHDVAYRLFDGHHDAAFWSAELPEALRWVWERIRADG